MAVRPHWFCAFEDVSPAKLDLFVDEFSACSHDRQMDSEGFALYAFVLVRALFFFFFCAADWQGGSPKFHGNLF